MNRPLPVVQCLIVSLILMLAGCNSRNYKGPPRYPVSGSVTVDGSPLSEGNITFAPTSQGGRAASGAIENGTYSIEEDRGPVEGTYRVKILGYETVKEAEDEDMGAATKQIIPPRYNEATTLEVEITSSGENKHDFDLNM